MKFKEKKWFLCIPSQLLFMWWSLPFLLLVRILAKQPQEGQSTPPGPLSPSLRPAPVSTTSHGCGTTRSDSSSCVSLITPHSSPRKQLVICLLTTHTPSLRGAGRTRWGSHRGEGRGLWRWRVGRTGPRGSRCKKFLKNQLRSEGMLWQGHSRLRVQLGRRRGGGQAQTTLAFSMHVW